MERLTQSQGPICRQFSLDRPPHWCYLYSMPARKLAPLSRRERQIMDVLYRRQHATVAEVLAGLPDVPSYSTVRAQLNVLEEKGHVRHQELGLRYQYVPTVPR